MGRRAKQPDLVAPQADPPKPKGLTPEASVWWDGVIRQKSGQLGPTEAFMMEAITKFMKLGGQYVERLDAESVIRQKAPDFSAHNEELVLKNYSTCVHNIVRLASEMGLTPRSRKQVPAVNADRKKKVAPKTSLDALKPTQFPTGTTGQRNGKHVGR